ncbi:glutathione gamma-glutamylcysteinyltransferase [Ranunculus cassubicifolius]
MATAGFYRRVLPSPPSIEFASPQGKKLFVEAVENGTMEGFFELISYFQTQSEPAYCGLASISMVLNALAIDPGRKWKGPWRWFDESMLDCCEPLEKVKAQGITFAKVACLAICNGAKVEAFRVNQSTLDDFRQYVAACTSSQDSHVITSYDRKAFKQTGSGHFSPIGGYHAGKDMVLILDVARFKYPPHWVPVSLLWEAMDTVDEATGFHRGFMIISRPHTATSLLYTLSCKDDNWTSFAKRLVDEVPVLLSSDDVKDVHKVLSVVFMSHSTVPDFIMWVVEVRKREDNDSSLSQEEKGRLKLKEEVLKEVKETELFKHVTEWLSSTNPSCSGTSCLKAKMIETISSKQGMNMVVPPYEPSSCLSSVSANCIETQEASTDGLTALILAMSPQTWLGIKDKELLKEMTSLVCTERLPPLLQEEVLYLRRQLYFLKKCLDDELAVPSFT